MIDIQKVAQKMPMMSHSKKSNPDAVPPWGWWVIGGTLATLLVVFLSIAKIYAGIPIILIPAAVLLGIRVFGRKNAGCVLVPGLLLLTPCVVVFFFTYVESFDKSVAPARSRREEALNTDGSSNQFVTRSDYGNSWAFTVDSGHVYSKSGAAIFESGGTEYALNGTAKERGYLSIDPIWRGHPESANGIRKIDIGPFIQAALKNPQ